ncbi:MAG TPA: HEAT repeat domain-containing protein [Geobacteraceae bacterium]
MPKPYDGFLINRNDLAGMSIEELLLMISDADKGFKPESMDMLTKMGLDTVYTALERSVRNGDNADLRNGAMEALVAFGPQAVPRLLELLGDENEEVRNFSTVMLGNIGHREAVRPLIQALKDPDVNVRHGAAEALGKIGDHGAFAPLIELLGEDFWVQHAAIVALGEIRDERAVPYLLAALDNELLMEPVSNALEKIGKHTG